MLAFCLLTGWKQIMEELKRCTFGAALMNMTRDMPFAFPNEYLAVCIADLQVTAT
jgi:hypothetical protein